MPIEARGGKMIERRKFQRKHLIYYLRIFDRNTTRLIGHLVDITPEGVMLMSEEPIETNTTLQLRMGLPKEIKKSKEITFDAKSLWCKKDINPDFYDTGFELLDVPREVVEIIKRLIRDFQFQD